jgi:hypothetical protein
LAEVFAPLAAAALARLAAGANAPFGASVIAGLGFALVALSRSRGGALALAVGALVAAVAWVTSAAGALRARRAGTLTLAAALVTLFLTILPQAAPFRESVASILDTRAPTNRVRLGLWEGAADLAVDAAPLGVGMGRFEAAFVPHRTAEEWSLSGADTRADDPHQEWLRAAAEGGVLGVLGLAFLFLLGAGRGFRAIRQGDPAGAPLLAAVAALLVTACLRSPFGHAGGSLAFGLLLGATGIAPPDRPRHDRIARTTAWILAIPAILAGPPDPRRRSRARAAVSSLNEGKAALADGDRAKARDALRAAGRAVTRLPGAPLKDPGRTFRAALAADDLEHARHGTFRRRHRRRRPRGLPRRRGDGSADRRHPPGRAAPHGLRRPRGASGRGIRPHRRRRDGAPRRHRRRPERSPAAAQPRRRPARSGRGNVGGPRARHRRRTALRGWCGSRDPEGAGPARSPAGTPALGGTPSGIADPPPRTSSGDRDRALRLQRDRLLAGLSTHPDQGGWLAALAETDYALGKGVQPLLAREANRAFARSRLRFAIDADAAGDRTGALRYLRLALRKDDGLRAARELAERWGEPLGDPAPRK